jgi:hypothetical protein
LSALFFLKALAMAKRLAHAESDHVDARRDLVFSVRMSESPIADAVAHLAQAGARC